MVATTDMTDTKRRSSGPRLVRLRARRDADRCCGRPRGARRLVFVCANDSTRVADAEAVVPRDIGAAAVAESTRKRRSPAGVFTCPRPNDVVIDLGAVDLYTYAVAGLRDDLVSREAACRSACQFGGRKRFVVSTSGHTQAQVNPPSPDSRSSYRLTDELPADSQDFFRQADVKPGSRWPDYAARLDDRSGELMPALKALRSSKQRASAGALVTYVHAA
jgi:hypothetical protein